MDNIILICALILETQFIIDIETLRYRHINKIADANYRNDFQSIKVDISKIVSTLRTPIFKDTSNSIYGVVFNTNNSGRAGKLMLEWWVQDDFKTYAEEHGYAIDADKLIERSYLKKHNSMHKDTMNAVFRLLSGSMIKCVKQAEFESELDKRRGETKAEEGIKRGTEKTERETEEPERETEKTIGYSETSEQTLIEKLDSMKKEISNSLLEINTKLSELRHTDKSKSTESLRADNRNENIIGISEIYNESQEDVQDENQLNAEVVLWWTILRCLSTGDIITTTFSLYKQLSVVLRKIIDSNKAYTIYTALVVMRLNSSDGCSIVAVVNCNEETGKVRVKICKAYGNNNISDKEIAELIQSG